MTVTLKDPKKMFCGKAKTGPTKGKNHQTTTRNNGTIVSHKDHCNAFESFLPNLLNYLQYLCNTFKAGQVAAHFAAWRALTSDRVLLSDVLGASIECTATPVQHRLPKQTFSEHEYPTVCQEVHKLFEKGVITKVSPMPGQILSGIFLRPKKDGSHRLILNLKRFNESASYYHFKMDSLDTITKLVTKNCFMASIDMKDAYYYDQISTTCNFRGIREFHER